jgi:hypothetical protein
MKKTTLPRANQTDWISRGVPLEKTLSAATGYINSFLPISGGQRNQAGAATRPTLCPFHP